MSERIILKIIEFFDIFEEDLTQLDITIEEMTDDPLFVMDLVTKNGMSPGSGCQGSTTRTTAYLSNRVNDEYHENISEHIIVSTPTNMGEII